MDVVTASGALTSSTRRDSGGPAPPAHVRAAARARRLDAILDRPLAIPLAAGPCDDDRPRRRYRTGGNTPAAAAARAHARTCKRKRDADTVQQLKDEAVAKAIVRDRAVAAAPSSHCLAAKLAALRARVLAKRAANAGGAFAERLGYSFCGLYGVLHVY